MKRKLTRSDIVEATGMVAVAFFMIGLLHVPAYVVVFFLVVYFYVLLHRKKHEVEKISETISKQLENKIKMKNSDVYLKQKQLITLISNLPVPLVLLDEEGKIVLYNIFFESFFESDEEIELTYMKNNFVEDVHRFINDAFIFERKMDKTMNVYGIEYQAIAAPITTKKKFSGCIIWFQDISKSKEKEDMQKQFVADASHELKTPISAIKGMIEIINRDNFHDIETEKEFLIQIEKETKRLDEIVQDLLQLSKLSTDVIMLKRTMYDLTKIIDDSVQSQKLAAQEKKVLIQKEYQSHDLIFIDVAKMKIVIDNLLNNAIHYSDRGAISLTTRVEDDTYIFEIKDQGKGLRKKDIERIFERFYRSDSARDRATGGSGLGLSIVKSIMEAHNAIITVESELGKGTLFRIEFK